MDRNIGQITVNSRTIDFDGVIVAIGAITQLRVIEYRDNPGFTPGRRSFITFAVAAALFGMLFISQFPGGDPTAATLAFFGFGSALAVAVYSAYGPMRRILAIELSSGSAYTLGAASVESLRELRTTIARVIENPPEVATPIPSLNVYQVDARNSRGVQVGSLNNQFNT